MSLLDDFFTKLDTLFSQGRSRGFVAANREIKRLTTATADRLSGSVADLLLVQQSALERRFILALETRQPYETVAGILRELNAVDFRDLRVRAGVLSEFAMYCKSLGKTAEARAVLSSLMKDLKREAAICGELIEMVKGTRKQVNKK